MSLRPERDRLPASPVALPQSPVRQTLQARIVWGQQVVTVGGDAPVRVQSMTNTDPVDVIGTAIQVKELVRVGAPDGQYGGGGAGGAPYS